MPSPRKDQIRRHIRDRYAGIAQSGGSCGCSSGCCQPDALLNPEASAQIEKDFGFKPDFDGWKKLDACEGCALKKYCGGVGLSVPCAKEEKEGDS